MEQVENIRAKLTRCIKSKITEFTVKNNSTLFAVPTISAKEIMDMAKQFDMAPNDIGISVYKPESLMVFFDVPNEASNHLEALIPITQFVCEVCNSPVTDTLYRTNQAVYRTEDCLYCSKCWKNSNRPYKMVKAYDENTIIDDIPREIQIWSMDGKSDEELR